MVRASQTQVDDADVIDVPVRLTEQGRAVLRAVAARSYQYRAGRFD